MCPDCLGPHQGCPGRVLTILDYAAETLLPQFSFMLLDLDRRRKDIEEDAAKFLHCVPKLQSSLMKIRNRMEDLWTQMCDAEARLEKIKNGGISQVYDTAKEFLAREYAKLKQEIAEGKYEQIVAEYILRDPNSGPDISAMGHTESEALVLEMKAAAEQLEKTGEVESVASKLVELNQVCRRTMIPEYCGAVSQLPTIYFTNCDVANDIYAFDTRTRKARVGTEVPQGASVIQLGRQIFLCGGNPPVSGNTFEYVEFERVLAPLATMVYARHKHTLCAITAGDFVAVGGSDEFGSYIDRVEEYSVPRNVWTELPRMTARRCYPGVVLLAPCTLYVFAGAVDSIERLNLLERKGWEVVKPYITELQWSVGPAGVQISRYEILILSSNTGVGIFNVQRNTIRRCQGLQPLLDTYSSNATCRTEEGDVYFTSNSGNVLRYRPGEKEFSRVDFRTAMTNDDA